MWCSRKRAVRHQENNHTQKLLLAGLLRSLLLAAELLKKAEWQLTTNLPPPLLSLHGWPQIAKHTACSTGHFFATNLLPLPRAHGRSRLSRGYQVCHSIRVPHEPIHCCASVVNVKEGRSENAPVPKILA